MRASLRVTQETLRFASRLWERMIP